MAGMLKVSDQEFKILQLMDKIDSMQKQLNKVSRKLEILRKISKRNARDTKIKQNKKTL